MDVTDPSVVSAVLDCLDSPAILLDTDHRILASNRAYHDAFATDGEILVGRYCYEVSHHYPVPCERLGESCPLLQSRETGEPSRSVHLHYTPRGEEHEDVVTRPVFGEDGEILAFVEIVQPSAIASLRPTPQRMVGRSPAFNRMLELVERVSVTETTVLLLGESGTGKELVARSVHRSSGRAHKAFVPVDCSGLSESLFESELFGHEKGAFTGALTRKKGLVEAADGGTLFLDEVGDIPLNLQVKLLRLIETGCFRRVGSTEQICADFRLVCATHRDLDEMVEAGAFRRDLYFRISAFPIPLPPLRARPEDVPLLIQALRERVIAKKTCRGGCRVDPATIEVLQNYAFPGNVRELLNLLERACLLADGDTILPDHLPEACRKNSLPPLERSGEIEPLADVEDRYLRWAAARFPGDKRELAGRLGLSERTLYRKLHKAQQE